MYWLVSEIVLLFFREIFGTFSCFESDYNVRLLCVSRTFRVLFGLVHGRVGGDYCIKTWYKSYNRCVWYLIISEYIPRRVHETDIIYISNDGKAVIVIIDAWFAINFSSPLLFTSQASRVVLPASSVTWSAPRTHSPNTHTHTRTRTRTHIDTRAHGPVHRQTVRGKMDAEQFLFCRVRDGRRLMKVTTFESPVTLRRVYGWI